MNAVQILVQRAVLLLVVILAASTLAACGADDKTAAPKPAAADEHKHAEGEEHTEGEEHKHAEGEEHKEGDEHAEGEEHKEGEEHAEGGEIKLLPAAIKEAGIVVESVKKQPVTASLSAPGRVVPTQAGAAHVGTVIPGRIARLLVSEGSFVRQGQTLAEIEALDIGQLKGQLMTARATVERTRSALARQQKLTEERIGAQRNLEEARAAHAEATAALRATEAELRAVGISPSSISSSGQFSSRIPIRSPISGVVSRRNVVLGEYLEANKDAFEVVNTSTVWIDAQVAPDVAGTLRVGNAGFIRDQTDHRHTGRISFIAPNVDPESRTVTVRVEVSNPDVHMRPETFVTVEFERSVSGVAISVPRAAVEQDGSNYFVYREHEPGTFERVMVQIGSETGDRRVITAGLKEGERIATAGLFYLKSARQKEELAEHDH